MSVYDPIDEPSLGTVDAAGRRFVVSCRITWDGIEHVGRLWFRDEQTSSVMADRGAIPGRTPEEVRALAERLTQRELAQRLMRALAEKRRFFKLRKATDDIIGRIRYLNQVTLAARAGLLDPEGAAGEIELTEKQLHEMVSQLRHYAGAEG